VTESVCSNPQVRLTCFYGAWQIFFSCFWLCFWNCTTSH